jgi:hypothetical protein
VTTTIATIPRATPAQLSLVRLHAMRAGYLLMAVGLMLVKWPKPSEVHTMPLYEGVTWCLLVAMSLLSFLGLRHPVKMLPVLVFEALWKVLWFCVVVLPQALDGGLDKGVADMLARNALVVVIIAVIPWRYTWQAFSRAPGDRWR